MHSRHERHVRDFDKLPLFGMLLVFLREDLVVFARGRKRVERMSLVFARVLERGDLLVLIVLKVAVGQISVVFGRFFVFDFFLAEVFRLGLRKVTEEHCWGDAVRILASVVECGGGLTIVKVRDGFENVTVCVERLWPADPAGIVSVGIQNNFGVDEIPRGYSLVQGLTESRSGRHVSGWFE